MAEFAGFSMPIQYSSVKEEVSSVREKVGVFDVSHMGEFFVKGPDAAKFVDFLITNDFYDVENKKAVYSPLCRDNGTVIDDLIAYKISNEEVMICVNASNIKKDWDWISSQKKNFEVTLTDESENTPSCYPSAKASQTLVALGVLKEEEIESSFPLLLH